MLKRYFVFIFRAYQEEGGWLDFSNSFGTIEESLEVITAEMRDPLSVHYSDSIAHVVDSQTGTIVANMHSNRGEAHSGTRWDCRECC